VAAASRLGRPLEEVIASLSKVDARFALIGGVALASHKVIRATQDIELLTDSEKAEDIDRELVAIGYQCLHRSADAGNYLRGDERMDFIYASRPAARGLLSDAIAIQTAFGELRVVSIEGLIGLSVPPQCWTDFPQCRIATEHRDRQSVSDQHASAFFAGRHRSCREN
jgi:hypothetical protein